jgi:hypothetical protein
MRRRRREGRRSVDRGHPGLGPGAGEAAVTEEGQLEALREAGFTAVTTWGGLRFIRQGDPAVYEAAES